MKVRVTIVETKQIYRTYEIDGVNDLETAERCAYRCANHQYQPNAYMMREIPHRPQFNTGSIEVVEV